MTATPASPWRTATPLALGVFLALIALFWPTFYSMVEIWERSETFAHGYVVFPISAWLIWRSRAEIAQITPHADGRGLIALLLAGAGWLLADAGSVNVVAQYALVAMLVASVWAVLGLTVVRAILFPLAFLFMAVPIGEFLIPPLMKFTADFTVAALKLTGIPVYREGLFFTIPSGNWSVVEGCSGLRYLIASITLGLLYAYLTYRSWRRRILFTVAAMLVPVLANGGRAYMIVMIAHLSDMQLALGVDHYIYGWAFFGLVMLILFWIGTFWREDDAPQLAAAPRTQSPTTVSSRATVGGVVAVAVLIALGWAGYAHWLKQRPLPPLAELALAPAAGWAETAAFTDWVPHWQGADRKLLRHYAKGERRVLLEVDYYATQRQDAELINSQNYMIRQKHEVWSNVGETVTTVEVAGRPRVVRQARLRSNNGQRLLVWQWNVVNGKPLMNDHRAKLELAWDRVRNLRDDGASVLVAAPYTDRPEEAAAVLRAFVSDMEDPIEATLARIEGE